VAFQDDDILRSIRRYLAMTLGEDGTGDTGPWKIRLERREVKDEDRPVAVILAGAINTVRARTSLIQGGVEEAMPITISLYPRVMSGSIEDVRNGRLEASKLKSQLNELLNTGLTITTEADGRTINWAGPLRLPLWDYAGVPIVGDEKGGPADPEAVMWVDSASLSVQGIQDPEDPVRWSVIGNFRISIERPGRTASKDDVRDIDRLVGVEKPIV
jgi:hypothetical protein